MKPQIEQVEKLLQRPPTVVTRSCRAQPDPARDSLNRTPARAQALNIAETVTKRLGSSSVGDCHGGVVEDTDQVAQETRPSDRAPIPAICSSAPGTAKSNHVDWAEPAAGTSSRPPQTAATSVCLMVWLSRRLVGVALCGPASRLTNLALGVCAA